MAFALSKLAWAFLSPGNLLVILLIAGLLLAALKRPACRKAGKVLCVLVASCFLAIMILPVGTWALVPLENRFVFNPPEHVDGIIVIGGDEEVQITERRGIPTALDSMRRFVTFADLSRRYPDAKLVFSGGAAFPHPFIKTEEADIARDILTDIGVSADRMAFERKSRNTWENAVYSADIMHPAPTQNWLLVTSAWHMTRAMGCFRKAGWNIYAAPTGYFTSGNYRPHFYFRFDEQMHMLSMAAHEYVGLLSYWLMGRTSALWPGQQ